MSLVQPDYTDTRLSSNNPFRNRAASPNSITSPTSPFENPQRPVSRNPFLDGSSTNILSQAPLASPDKMSFAADAMAPRPVLSGNAADLFDNLTLDDKPASRSDAFRPPPPGRSNTAGSVPPTSNGAPRGNAPRPRGENIPPRGAPGHRPSRSQEEAMRARRLAASSSKSRTQELDIFADPVPSSKSDPRRVRRNSESSVMESKPKPKVLDAEEEKKRQERRERRHRERAERGSKSKKPDRKLDIIDQLDATSIYGTGLFHHDGPFDACNPHRNRQGSRRAPMQAFPKDSLNNVIGGGGPLNKRPDHAAFLGHNDDEAFKDYSKGGYGTRPLEPYGNGAFQPSLKAEPALLNATSKVEPVHGEETLGLGTSTFLDGAPASKAALQRRENELSPVETNGGGLGRKKSLAQKIRGINGRRDGPSGRVVSPEITSPDAPAYTPGGTRITESNPFFNEFSKGDDSKKPEGITIVEPERPTGRARAPSSPRRGFGETLQRRVTSDSTTPIVSGEPGAKPGGGFLSRVKSLKGGPRKPREKPLPPPGDD